MTQKYKIKYIEDPQLNVNTTQDVQELSTDTPHVELPNVNIETYQVYKPIKQNKKIPKKIPQEPIEYDVPPAVQEFLKDNNSIPWMHIGAIALGFTILSFLH